MLRLTEFSPLPRYTPLRMAEQPRDTAWIRSFAGKFVVFDGPDGSGKTTQFIRAVKACRGAGVAVCEVREPGGTEVGEAIRDLLLHRERLDVTARCEMLLYMASRAQLVETRIAPALARRELVLADRFVSSTLAYQGAAGGVPAEHIERVAEVACMGARPDLVVIFDVDDETAARRMGRTLDRMESKGVAFRALVREAYLDQAKHDPTRHVVIDARGTEDEVAGKLMGALAEWTSKRA